MAQGTEPKRFFLFVRVTYNTGRDERVPFTVFFGIVQLFFQKIPKAPFLEFCERMYVEKSHKVAPFSFFSAWWGFFKEKRAQYFDTLKSFCYFWASDWRQLGPVLTCFRCHGTYENRPFCFSPVFNFNWQWIAKWWPVWDHSTSRFSCYFFFQILSLNHGNCSEMHQQYH